MAEPDVAAKPNGISGIKFIYRALQYRNYRLFFTGQLISLMGTWLTVVSTQWLVYRLAAPIWGDVKSARIVGIAMFAGQIPIFLLAPFGGVLADRFNHHRTLLVTQTLSMLQSFALAALALPKWITIPEIIALNAFQGLVNALDIPTRQAFVVEMVENREDLGNAIALNSSMVHLARFVGPAVAGMLIYWSSAGVCFFIDGLSYLAVLIALLCMRLRPIESGRKHSDVLRSLKDGLSYAWSFLPIRTILMTVAIISLMAAAQATLMPIIAVTIMGGKSRTFGLLLSFSGIGAFAGSLYLASRRSVIGLGRVIAIAIGTLGVGMIAFSVSRFLPEWHWLRLLCAAPVLVITGGSVVVAMASSNTVLQTIVDDDKRGRIMSLFAMSFIGMAPFGNLLGGEISSHILPLPTLTLCGAVCLLASGFFFLRLRTIRPLIRPIYIRKGILPQVVTAVRDTANLTTAADE